MLLSKVGNSSSSSSLRQYQTIPLSKIEDFGVHAKQVRLAAPAAAGTPACNGHCNNPCDASLLYALVERCI
jgi:hypothetical protein